MAPEEDRATAISRWKKPDRPAHTQQNRPAGFNQAPQVAESTATTLPRPRVYVCCAEVRKKNPKCLQGDDEGEDADDDDDDDDDDDKEDVYFGDQLSSIVAGGSEQGSECIKVYYYFT